MKPSKDKTYYCQQCRSPTSTLHEIVYGSANRKIAIDYSVQIPLCTMCHSLAHKHKEQYQRLFLDWLSLDYWVTIRAFNNRNLRGYLDIHREDCEAKIKELEI